MKVKLYKDIEPTTVQYSDGSKLEQFKLYMIELAGTLGVLAKYAAYWLLIMGFIFVSMMTLGYFFNRLG